MTYVGFPAGLGDGIAAGWLGVGGHGVASATLALERFEKATLLARSSHRLGVGLEASFPNLASSADTRSTAFSRGHAGPQLLWATKHGVLWD
jgi:hypothetical protein